MTKFRTKRDSSCYHLRSRPGPDLRDAVLLLPGPAQWGRVRLFTGARWAGPGWLSGPGEGSGWATFNQVNGQTADVSAG